jgi:hypothetical protein
MGWASLGKVVEAAFTTTGDFVEREKDGFMGNPQYIADCPLIRLSAFAFHRHLAFPAFGRARNVMLAGPTKAGP